MNCDKVAVRMDQLTIAALFVAAAYWVMFPMIRLLEGTKLRLIASDPAQWAAALFPIATVIVVLLRRYIGGQLRPAPLIVLAIGASMIVLARCGPESKWDSEALAILFGVLLMAAGYFAQVFLAVTHRLSTLGQGPDETASTRWPHRVRAKGVR
jgi:hypothetical protein